MTRGKLQTKDVLAISRPVWWLLSGSLFAAGALLAQREVSISLLVGLVYFLIPYNLLRFGIGAIYDYGSELRKERQGIATSGPRLPSIKHPALWKVIISLNAPLILLLFVLGNIEASVFLIMMVYMIVAFNLTGLRYKEIPIIDSLTWAFIATSPFIFGLLFFASPYLWSPVYAALYFLAVGIYAARSMRSIRQNRMQNIKTTGTYLGGKKTKTFSYVAFGLSVVAPVLAYGPYGFAVLLLVVPALAWLNLYNK